MNTPETSSNDPDSFTALSFAETMKKKPFDWNAFLKKTEHTKIELFDAEQLAGSWVTCACGNLCDAIPRWECTGSPKDRALKHLGIRFMNSISRMHLSISEKKYQLKFEEEKESTIHILHKIEVRSKEILCVLAGNKGASVN